LAMRLGRKTGAPRMMRETDIAPDAVT
jgi:hypothetical protein